MRYPFTPVPAIPSTPDVSIGVTLQKIEPAGSGGGGGSASSSEVGLYWAGYPTRGADDDVLSLIRRQFSGEHIARTVPPLCAAVPTFPTWASGCGTVTAYLENVPDGATITWNVPEPVLNTAAEFSWVVASASPGVWHVSMNWIDDIVFVIRNNGRTLSFAFQLPDDWVYLLWWLDPIVFTATVNGIDTRALTLNVTALPFGSGPPLPEE